MNAEKIGKFEAICLILIIIVNEIVLNVPNLIIYTDKEDCFKNSQNRGNWIFQVVPSIKEITQRQYFAR